MVIFSTLSCKKRLIPPRNWFEGGFTVEPQMDTAEWSLG